MKSKIEEKIKNAREATNEMFAALDEMNERLSKNVIEVSINAKRESLNIPSITCIFREAKWMPKRGEYATIKYAFNGEPQQYICIINDKLDKTHYPYAIIDTTGKLHISRGFYFDKGDVACPSNQQERQLLDDKLKESGKRFDKEKLELVDIMKEPKFKKGDLVRTPDGYIFEVSEAVTNTMKTEWLYCKNPKMTFFGNYIEESKLEKYEPKHKEPIIGEMAIMWGESKATAFVAKYEGMNAVNYHTCNRGTALKNAILFESPEQYKAFLKS